MQTHNIFFVSSICPLSNSMLTSLYNPLTLSSRRQAGYMRLAIRAGPDRDTIGGAEKEGKTFPYSSRLNGGQLFPRRHEGRRGQAVCELMFSSFLLVGNTVSPVN